MYHLVIAERLALENKSEIYSEKDLQMKMKPQLDILTTAIVVQKFYDFGKRKTD